MAANIFLYVVIVEVKTNAKVMSVAVVMGVGGLRKGLADGAKVWTLNSLKHVQIYFE